MNGAKSPLLQAVQRYLDLPNLTHEHSQVQQQPHNNNLSEEGEEKQLTVGHMPSEVRAIQFSTDGPAEDFVEQALLFYIQRFGVQHLPESLLHAFSNVIPATSAQKGDTTTKNSISLSQGETK